MKQEDNNTKVELIYNVLLAYITDTIDAEDSMTLIDQIICDEHIQAHKHLYDAPENLRSEYEDDDEPDEEDYALCPFEIIAKE